MDRSAPIEDLLERFSGKEGALIPLLQAVQKHHGYLRPAHIEQIARHLKLSPSEVYSVATFYAQFRLTPPGKTAVRVCRGTACHVRGSARILQEMETEVNCRAGSTSEDFEYSLEEIACFGACSLAPVLVIDGEVHGRQTPEAARKLVRMREVPDERPSIAAALVPAEQPSPERKKAA